MKQEHRLVAEVYRYIAPFVDTDSEVYLSLDGQAAQTGVSGGHFEDSAIPDMWVTIVGSSVPTLIEAKALDKNGRVLLMQSQLKAWRTNGTGAHCPELWIATSNDFSSFMLWSHEAFVPALDRTQNRQNTVSLSPPVEHQRFPRLSELALAILMNAQQNAVADAAKLRGYALPLGCK